MKKDNESLYSFRACGVGVYALKGKGIEAKDPINIALIESPVNASTAHSSIPTKHYEARLKFKELA